MPAPFTLSANTCPTSLTAGDSCTVGVLFQPTADGSYSGALAVNSSAVDDPASIALTAMSFDFTLAAAGSTSQTVASGQTAGFSISVTPVWVSSSQFSPGGTFTFSCGTLPKNALCLSNPTSEPVTSGASGNALMQIYTGGSKSSAQLAKPVKSRPGGAFPLICGLLFLPLALVRKLRRRLLPLFVLLVIAVCGVFELHQLRLCGQRRLQRFFVHRRNPGRNLHHPRNRNRQRRLAFAHGNADRGLRITAWIGRAMRLRLETNTRSCSGGESSTRYTLSSGVNQEDPPRSRGAPGDAADREPPHMTTKVTVEDVERVAELAHLELAPEETPRMLRDLNAILDYVAELNELDTAGVSPLAQVSELETAATATVLRADAVRPSLDRSAVMSQAPESDKVFFKVPKVIER